MKVEHKGYIIEGDGTFGLKVIRRVGKGALPKILSGKFTGFEQAKTVIDSVEKRKRETNGEENISG